VHHALACLEHPARLHHSERRCVFRLGAGFDHIEVQQFKPGS